MVVAREAIWLIRLAAYSILYHNILLVLHAVSRHFQVKNWPNQKIISFCVAVLQGCLRNWTYFNEMSRSSVLQYQLFGLISPKPRVL